MRRGPPPFAAPTETGLFDAIGPEGAVAVESKAKSSAFWTSRAEWLRLGFKCAIRQMLRFGCCAAIFVTRPNHDRPRCFLPLFASRRKKGVIRGRKRGLDGRIWIASAVSW